MILALLGMSEGKHVILHIDLFSGVGERIIRPNITHLVYIAYARAGLLLHHMVYDESYIIGMMQTPLSSN